MKIEDKLKELGYKTTKLFPRQYTKQYNYYIIQVICLSKPYGIDNVCEIDDSYIEINGFINTQQGVDSIQEAFNRLQEDLKKLQEFESVIEEVEEWVI